MNEWLLWVGCIFLIGIALAILFYPLRKHRWFFLSLMPVVVVTVSLGYWYWGSAGRFIQYQHEIANQTKVQALLTSVGGLEAIITKIKATLDKEPTSTRGWYLLGKLYASKNEWQLSKDAYRKAYELDNKDLEVAINYAHSLWQAEHLQFNDTIRSLYKNILLTHKDEPNALAMLAMDAFMRHAYKDAIDYWQTLLRIVPPESQEAHAIEEAIVRAKQKMS